MEINIVNKKTHKPTAFDIYIGRGSALGNPFTYITDRATKAEFLVSSRDECIRRYDSWLKQQIQNRNKTVIGQLNSIAMLLRGNGTVNLVCYCAPLACHGEVVKRIVEKALKKGLSLNRRPTSPDGRQQRMSL